MIPIISQTEAVILLVAAGIGIFGVCIYWLQLIQIEAEIYRLENQHR